MGVIIQRARDGIIAPGGFSVVRYGVAVPRAAAGVANWWDPNNEGLCVWGAWQAIAADSYASSLLDLTGNGNDISDPGSTQTPSWTEIGGWSFDGSNDYLDTLYVPDNSGGDQDRSVFVRFSNWTGPYSYIVHCLTNSSPDPQFGIRRDGVYYYNQGGLTAGPTLLGGTLGIAGNLAFRDGVQETGTISTNASVHTETMVLAARNWAGTVQAFGAMKIQALVIYECAVTADQAEDISLAMMALDFDWSPEYKTIIGEALPAHWYRADDGYTDAGRTDVADEDDDLIASLTDRAANSDHISQSTESYRPTLKTEILNGHPVMRFAGSQFVKGTFTTGGTMAQPSTAYLVAKCDASYVSDGVSRTMIDSDGTETDARMGLHKHSYSPNDKWEQYSGASLYGSDADSDWHIFTGEWSGTDKFWLDGVLEASGNAGVRTNVGIAIGQGQGGGRTYWRGDIAEVIWYTGTHSTADKNLIGNYLADRYGLSYTDIT